MTIVHYSIKKVGTTTTACYIQHNDDGTHTVLTEAEYAALTKVKCPLCETVTKDICVQPKGNTDATLIEEGCLTYVQTTKFSDMAGTVSGMTQSPHQLFLNGTDVTATHEKVDCPEPVVIEGSVCIDAGAKKKVATKTVASAVRVAE